MVGKEWIKAQQHEKEYFTSGKNKQWKTPHSLDYWKEFLSISYFYGRGLEIGCGPNGIYNFTDCVVGIDPINYYKHNFINCMGEYLPFQSKSFDFIICCNSLDHCQNPVIRLEYSHEHYFTNKLPVTYNPKADCPKFKKFLEQILPEEKFRKQIQEMFGWTLRRDYTHQYVFLLIGDGSNGKSVLLGVLCAVLGSQNVTSISLQRLCENRFMTSHLYQKLANILPDMPGAKIVDSSIFKALTGGDIITAEVKNGKFFEFINFAKLIFSMNKVPYSPDKSIAYYRRIMLIFFNVRFGDGGLPRDINKLKEITTPEELSGILNWALEGLKRLNKQGDFSNRMSVAETQEYYNRLISPISAFLKENITEADNDDEVDFIPKDYLLAEIQKYCEEKQLLKHDVSKTKIAYIIKKSYGYIKSGQRTVGNKPRTHVWNHCKFIDGSIAKLDYTEYLESLKSMGK